MLANKKRKELFLYRFLKGWMPIILSGKRQVVEQYMIFFAGIKKNQNVLIIFTYFGLCWVFVAARAFLWLW